jgi:hypothetical protein
MSTPDIFLSHDWPQGIEHQGNLKRLLQKKKFFKADIDKVLLSFISAPPLLVMPCYALLSSRAIPTILYVFSSSKPNTSSQTYALLPTLQNQPDLRSLTGRTRLPTAAQPAYHPQTRMVVLRPPPHPLRGPRSAWPSRRRRDAARRATGSAACGRGEPGRDRHRARRG